MGNDSARVSLPCSVAAPPHSSRPRAVAADEDSAVYGMVLLGVTACIAASWWWPLLLAGLALVGSGVALRRLAVAAAAAAAQALRPARSVTGPAPTGLPRTDRAPAASPGGPGRPTPARHVGQVRASGPETERVTPAVTTSVTTLLPGARTGTAAGQVA